MTYHFPKKILESRTPPSYKGRMKMLQWTLEKTYVVLKIRPQNCLSGIIAATNWNASNVSNIKLKQSEWSTTTAHGQYRPAKVKLDPWIHIWTHGTRKLSKFNGLSLSCPRDLRNKIFQKIWSGAMSILQYEESFNKFLDPIRATFKI